MSVEVVNKDLSTQGFIGAESRKGEIVLLRDNLQACIDKRDVPGQVAIMRKIIESITLGSDCSELYFTVIMVCFHFYYFLNCYHSFIVIYILIFEITYFFSHFVLTFLALSNPDSAHQKNGVPFSSNLFFQKP